jgi:hypothetical protein
MTTVTLIGQLDGKHAWKKLNFVDINSNYHQHPDIFRIAITNTNINKTTIIKNISSLLAKS